MIFIPRQNLVLDMLASLVPTREPLRIVLQIKGREVCLEKGTKSFGGIDLNEREVCPANSPQQEGRYLGGSGSCSEDFSSRSSGPSQASGGRNTAKTLSELVIHESKNSASSGLRLSSAIAPARQNQFNSS